TGTTRLAIGAPAVSSRSTGAVSGWSILRTAGSAGAVPFAVALASAGPVSSTVGSSAVGSSADPAVAGPSAVDSSPDAGSGGSAGASGLPSTHDTNWVNNLPLTSAIMPRPNWATLPLMVTSLSTSTWVDRSSPTPVSVIVTVMTASALP